MWEMRRSGSQSFADSMVMHKNGSIGLCFGGVVTKDSWAKRKSPAEASDFDEGTLSIVARRRKSLAF